MAHQPELTLAQEALTEAVKQGDEARARSLLPQLGSGPQQVRTALEAMVEDPRSLVRQAAAFGLGELGGAASVQRLERQLAIEEARRDHDGEAIGEEIVRALSRISDSAAREALVRKLERLSAGRPERSDVNEAASALWKKRHPALLPVVRRSLQQLAVPEPNALRGLVLLLEMSPAELHVWAADPSVPLVQKSGVLTLLEEDLPTALRSVLPQFISAAQEVLSQALSQRGAASYFCEVLFDVVLMHRARVLGELPAQARATLRQVVRSLVAAVSMGCALKAARVLGHVGQPEDVALLEAHRPADPTFAKVFDEAARSLRHSTNIQR